MTFHPEHPAEIPSPDQILAKLDREPSDPAAGYITPEDIRYGWEAMISAIVYLAQRVTAHDHALTTGGVVPSADGQLFVDIYSGSFVRLRDTANLLDDGQPHFVTLALATDQAPGGTIVTDPNTLPSGTQGAYFDHGGQIGSVVETDGSPVTQGSIRNWTKYPDSYLLRVTEDVTTDPAHPKLIVSATVVVTPV